MNFNSFKKYLWLLVFFILQLSFFTIFHFEGVVPNLILFFSKYPHQLLIISAGLLLDIFFYPGFGIGLLTLATISFLFFKLIKKLLFKDNLIVFLVSLIGVTFLYYLLITTFSYGLSFIFVNIKLINLKPFLFILKQSLYNLIIGLIVFLLFNKKHLK